MNERKRFQRKITYYVASALLLLPLFMLGQPATTEENGGDGGKLARMRREYGLSQANLGDIDPISETMKMSTLGLRGVALSVLWIRSSKDFREENWDSLQSTLEVMARLNPNCVSVWVFQGWNLAYNSSVEFDDYHDRYHWVMRGIDYLIEGISHNRKETVLVAELARTIAQKVGRSDEHVQFRRLFREDHDFHARKFFDDDELNADLARANGDSWLVARAWHLKGERMVDQQGLPVKGNSPLLFHVQPSMYLIYGADAIEREGRFGEVAKKAWKDAGDSLTEYSHRDLPTIFNFTIRLADLDHYRERSKEAQAELDSYAPARTREKIRDEKLAALSSEERLIWSSPSNELSEQQHMAWPMINGRLQVSHRDVAERVTGPDRPAALKAAERAAQADEVARVIEGDRDIVNFDYWALRCEVERFPETLEAHKLLFDADKEFTAAHLTPALELYDEGWSKWKKVIEKFPKLLDDRSLIEELMEAINRYKALLHQLDQKFPANFPLQVVIDADLQMHGGQQAPQKSENPFDELRGTKETE